MTDFPTMPKGVEHIDSQNSLMSVYTLRTMAYCERLFYMEEVEGIQVADAQIYSGRTLHEKLAQDELNQGEWASFELSCEELGLKGKVDCFRYREGNLIPYEHKLGKHCKKGKESSAWPSDVIQITAYGMLLEKETGRTISEGRIRYHATNTTIRIPLVQLCENLQTDKFLIY